MITLLSLNKIARKVYSFLPLTVRSYIFNLRYAKQSKIKIKLGHHDRKPDWLKWAETANKVAIIPCSFEFDELVNQRPINAAKYFASKGYKVLFIAWQWKKNKKLHKSNQEVLLNIYQVSLYDFIEGIDLLGYFRESFFLLTIPADIFTEAQITLRSKGFTIIYDIMDEWEQFYLTGQAPWYKRDVENNCVLFADRVTAVAPSLVKKFQCIRTDIHIIGNGFSKDVIGLNNSRIALASQNNITVGYFGHLTDAWFDWPLIIKTARDYPCVVFDIIGYGEPEWVQKECATLDNIRLIGKVHPKLLNKYVSKWRIGIIPFKESPLAEAVDPIKVYEYLFFGLPVVTTGIQHIERYPMTYVANKDNFKSILDSIMIKKWDEEIVSMFLEKVTWEHRFDLMLAGINCKTIGHLYEK